MRIYRRNFYEVKYPWLGAGAKIQTFAEYWQDTGPDGLILGDEGYEEADAGENNGRWDEGEKYTDANGIEKYTTQVILQNYNGTLTMIGGRSNSTEQIAPSQDSALSNSDPFPGGDDVEIDDEIPF